MLLMAAVILGYMLLLIGLAVASPGIGFTGTLISFVPDNWRDWAHVPAYGLLAWLAIQGFRLRGWPLPYAMLCGILLTAVFGLWTEVAQGFAPGRETSLHDLLNDTVGGMMAATLVLWQCRLSRSTPSLILMRAPRLRRLMKGTLSR
ncbi:MAG: VanZ family protein [Nitrospira defluvii]|nr:VanZ family protein [Nitrospira defluvii]